MSRHRAGPVRPRYGRVALVLAAVLVTGVAVLGRLSGGGEVAALARDTGSTEAPAPTTPSETVASVATVSGPRLHRDKSVPTDSGVGRRIVFSETRQRVWLIDEADAVERTYLVSGSAYDNLDPGTYAVYSRSEDAYGVDDSGTMKYFVRFTEGANAAIGFHDIPIDDGELVQTTDELGIPLSHGCIRQKRPDAIALWDFAPVGTPVVVTA